MPHCQNCGVEWSWFDTFKISFKGTNICSACGEKQHILPDLRFKTYLLYMTPLFILIVSGNFLNFSTAAIFTIALVYFFAMLIFAPYKIKLSNHQKPLW